MKNLSEIQRIWDTLDNQKEPYGEADEAWMGQSKGEGNMEVTSIQDPIPLEFNDEEGRLVIDDRTSTNNMFNKENLREII